MKINALVKIIIIALLSSLILINSHLLIMLFITLLSFALSLLSNANLAILWKRSRHYIKYVFALAIVTSLFVSDGKPIIYIGDFTLLTTHGITHSIRYIFRLFVILFSAITISSSTPNEIIYSLNKVKIPYIICFMVTVSLRFLPEFKLEYKVRLETLELRGIIIDELSLKEKMKVYSYLISPTINGALISSENLAKSLYARGFTVNGKRTKYREYLFCKKDYLILFGFLALIALVLITRSLI